MLNLFKKKLSIEEKSQLAKSALADEALTEAMAKMEADLIAAWKVTPSDRADLREGIWLKYDAMRNIKMTLNGFISTAVLEKKRREEQNGTDINS